LEGIAGVKEEEIRHLAGELFDERFFCLTVLGSLDGKDLGQDLLKLD